MNVLLANPRGFCAGVDRAIAIVDRALSLLGAPVYVRHEVVHNQFVVDQLKQRGAIFVEEVDEVPEGETVIFSAHGVSQHVKEAADERNLRVFDATCPLVTKVHIEVARHAKNQSECVLIGHRGHPEVEGTLGQYNCETGGIYLVENEADVMQLEVTQPDRLHYVTQTTLSVDDTKKVIAALKKRFPMIQGPRKDDICYATQNRQDAVKQLAQLCDLVLVVGSTNSSNSNRLREIAARSGKKAYLIDGYHQIDDQWLHHCNTVGVTAGASAPETLVQEVVNYLKAQGAEDVRLLPGEPENVAFSLPKALREVKVTFSKL